DAAEAAIQEALTFGRLALIANPQQAFDLQIYALRREQGRLGEVIDIVERAADEYPAYPIWRYVLPDVLAQLDRAAEARAAVDAVAGEGFPVYGAGGEMQWLISASLLPEVCRFLGDVSEASKLYDLLLPFAELNAVTPPEFSVGSVSRGLGILAAVRSA